MVLYGRSMFGDAYPLTVIPCRIACASSWFLRRYRKYLEQANRLWPGLRCLRGRFALLGAHASQAAGQVMLFIKPLDYF
jgi:hypothetical protein